MELNEVLVWLAGGGAVIVVSWLFERWAWFQALVSAKKEALFTLAVFLFAAGAYAVTTYVSPAFLEQISPWFKIFISAIGAGVLGKGFHWLDKK
jgi:hypothetical protein